jgi:hypothetical protein
MTTKSPYIRDIVADMDVFRTRGVPLPMRPVARCSKATRELLPQRPKPPDHPLPHFFAGIVPIGSIYLNYDESIPLGTIEIDGTAVPLQSIIDAVAEAART